MQVLAVELVRRTVCCHEGARRWPSLAVQIED
jgi:hypothetical protein